MNKKGKKGSVDLCSRRGKKGGATLCCNHFKQKDLFSSCTLTSLLVPAIKSIAVTRSLTNTLKRLISLKRSFSLITIRILWSIQQNKMMTHIWLKSNFGKDWKIPILDIKNIVGGNATFSPPEGAAEHSAQSEEKALRRKCWLRNVLKGCTAMLASLWKQSELAVHANSN